MYFVGRFVVQDSYRAQFTSLNLLADWHRSNRLPRILLLDEQFGHFEPFHSAGWRAPTFRELALSTMNEALALPLYALDEAKLVANVDRNSDPNPDTNPDSNSGAVCLMQICLDTIADGHD